MAAQLLFNKAHDDSGRLARGGWIHTPLVEKWLEQVTINHLSMYSSCVQRVRYLDNPMSLKACFNFVFLINIIYNNVSLFGFHYKTLFDRSFFQKLPPKSTGRELYTMGYLQDRIKDCRSEQMSDMDIMATITELTVQSIAHSYRTFLPTTPDEVLVSGGGSHNRQLMERLQEVLSPMKVTTTESVGINVDYKEAVAFAVLGYMRMKEQPGNLPSVTGASRQVLLGEVSHP
ncbi:anhydro-N-acetylmuramic acid kinase-like [Branchiostoma floridae x Branchiostoma japonicum]